MYRKRFALTAFAFVCSVMLLTWQRTESGQSKSVEQLVKELKSADADARAEAAEALGKLKAKDAVPGLIAALKDADENVRDAAADAPDRICAAATAALPAAAE